MALINLTPHEIVLVGGPTIPPSGAVARVASVATWAGEFEGVALSRVAFGDVQNLPTPQAGVIYIVSALVRAAVPSRADVASPGELVRSADGQPVGCKGLIIN